MRDKFRELRIAWKAILLVTPYIRVKRECAGNKAKNPSTAWRAVHREKSCVKVNQVQPSRLVAESWIPVRGHPLFRRVCTSVTNGIAFQAIQDLRKLNL